MLHENSRACSVDFDFDAIDAPPKPGPAAPPTPEEIHYESLEFGRRLVSFIRRQGRARLTVDCLYLAMGDADLELVTMTDIAKLHGVSKAAVSKRVRKLRVELHLPPNANNKSERARDTYARTNCSPIRLDKSASGV